MALSQRVSLTDDRMPLVATLFGFCTGTLILFSGALGIGAYSTFHSLNRGAPTTAIRCSAESPPVCAPYSVREVATEHAFIAVCLFILACVLWRIGFTHRYVWREGQHIVITWGSIVRVPLHRYAIANLQSITITKELRFSLSPIVGTSIQRVRKAPDRWRMKATHKNATVNLGSYASESAANSARSLLS